MGKRLLDKFGLMFISGCLLTVAAFRVWSTPAGEMFAAVLLGSALILLGFAAREWIHESYRDKDDDE